LLRNLGPGLAPEFILFITYRYWLNDIISENAWTPRQFDRQIYVQDNMHEIEFKCKWLYIWVNSPPLAANNDDSRDTPLAAGPFIKQEVQGITEKINWTVIAK
jgi:hypothetical protein